MKLALKKPIVFFDLETTGLNLTQDRIIELSLLKVYPNGNEEAYTKRINPGIPIPPESTAIHGITNEDVKDCPPFKAIAKELSHLFEGADIAGYNSNRFDIPMLAEEFSRAEADIDFSRVNSIDVQNIFHKMERRTLEAAYLFYCGEELDNAHSAEADTRATYRVLQAQLDKYTDKLKNDIDFLAEFSRLNDNVDLAGRLVRGPKGETLINFGKHKGKPVEEVLVTEPSYYGWIMNSDFPSDTKRHFSRIRLKLGNLKK